MFRFNCGLPPTANDITIPAQNIKHKQNQLESFFHQLKQTSDQRLPFTILKDLQATVPFEDRPATFDALQAKIGQELSDKRKHSLLVCTALSGAGKTRIFSEFERIKASADNKCSWNPIQLYTSYKKSTAEVPTETKFDAACVLAWRIVHWYFGPQGKSWATFFSEVVEKDLVSRLDIQCCLKEIADDAAIDDNDRGNLKPIVFVICIDDFHLLEPNRLGSVVRLLSDAMTSSSAAGIPHYIVIPIFAGTKLGALPEAAASSGVNWSTIPLPTLTFDSALNILRYFLKRHGLQDLLRSARLRAEFFQLSSVPRAIVELAEGIKTKSDWAGSFQEASSTLCQGLAKSVAHDEKLVLELVAWAVTGLPLPEVKRLAFDHLAVHWELEDSKVAVPFALLKCLAVHPYDHTRVVKPADDFVEAMYDCLAFLVSSIDEITSSSSSINEWTKVEQFSVWHAIRINAFGILGYKKLKLSQVLPGCVFGSTEGSAVASNIEVDICPTTMIVQFAQEQQYVDHGGFVILWPPNPKTIVDASIFFPTARFPGQTLFRKLIVLDQRKYSRHGGGLASAGVFENSLTWCSRTRKLLGKDVASLFLVVDPFQSVSIQDAIGELQQPSKGRFVCALGRDGCNEHFNIIADVVVPRIFVNSARLNPNLLALALPKSWDEKKKGYAQKIVDYDYELQSWKELCRFVGEKKKKTTRGGGGCGDSWRDKKGEVVGGLYFD